jgi:hypothetical protein
MLPLAALAGLSLTVSHPEHAFRQSVEHTNTRRTLRSSRNIVQGEKP